MHETKMHRYNTWLTLTYDDEHLPKKYYTGIIHPHTGKKIYSGTLYKPHMQQFYRRLRKALSSKKAIQDTRILYTLQERADMGLRPIPRRPTLRYYYGGEYGDRYRRPHYHVCLFGIEFADRKHVDTTKLGFKLYESERLRELWPYGQHMIGDLTWETAAYTARYIMKKVTGDQAEYYYRELDFDTGEWIDTQPEFNDMSRNKGIGHDWYQRYTKDAYKQKESYVRVRNAKTKPPRYYDKLHQRQFPEHYETIKRERRKEAIKKAKNFTKPRLLAAEKITNQKIQSLRQKIEGH